MSLFHRFVAGICLSIGNEQTQGIATRVVAMSVLKSQMQEQDSVTSTIAVEGLNSTGFITNPSFVSNIDN